MSENSVKYPQQFPTAQVYLFFQTNSPQSKGLQSQRSKKPQKYSFKFWDSLSFASKMTSVC